MGDGIKNIHARQVLDSRGNPTVECEIHTEKDFLSRSMVPSGASTGSNEALELRDQGKAYAGKGVLKAVENINRGIAKNLGGMDVTRQRELDNAMLELDGTENKDRLGANAILAVSMAAAKAAAAFKGIPLYQHISEIAGGRKLVLPAPQMNVMNGGKHAQLEEDIQEQMIFPVGAKTYSQALQMGAETHHALKKILKKKFGAQGTLIGDEGGFAPPVKNAHERLELMEKAVEEAGYSKEIKFAIDSAATEFCENGKYRLYGKEYDAGELVDFYADMVKEYPVISLEDGMGEEDWQGWKMLTEKLGGKVQVVGDDLLVTNPKMIEKAVGEKACNALLLKVNQIGTVSEAIDAALLSFKNGWNVVVSHRSGETEDAFIADLVVGLGTGQSKFGAPVRSDRNAKYNQLLRIEEELDGKGVYAGSELL